MGNCPPAKASYLFNLIYFIFFVYDLGGAGSEAHFEGRKRLWQVLISHENRASSWFPGQVESVRPSASISATGRVGFYSLAACHGKVLEENCCADAGRKYIHGICAHLHKSFNRKQWICGEYNYNFTISIVLFVQVLVRFLFLWDFHRYTMMQYSSVVPTPSLIRSQPVQWV